MSYFQFKSSYTDAIPLTIHTSPFSSTCFSGKAAGGTQSAVCTVLLYAFTNCCSTSTNLQLFL